MMALSTVTFCHIGGIPQERYEELRGQWLASDGGCVFTLLRKPWGTRLLHFGMLGLLDEDFTDSAWFGPSSGASSSSGIHSTRVFLGGEDGNAREHAAYCYLLALPDAMPLKVAEGGR